MHGTLLTFVRTYNVLFLTGAQYTTNSTNVYISTKSVALLHAQYIGSLLTTVFVYIQQSAQIKKMCSVVEAKL